jgi:hypothetical protein
LIELKGFCVTQKAGHHNLLDIWDLPADNFQETHQHRPQSGTIACQRQPARSLFYDLPLKRWGEVYLVAVDDKVLILSRWHEAAEGLDLVSILDKKVLEI